MIDASSAVQTQTKERPAMPVVVNATHDTVSLLLPEESEVEQATGSGSLQFRRVALGTEVTIANLLPETLYRFRIRLTTAVSDIVDVATLAWPRDEWALVKTRSPRSADAGYGRAGSLENTTTRLIDPPYANVPAFPSPRRGHTLTRLLLYDADEAWAHVRKEREQQIYLFGGFGDGYECDGPFGATFRLGSPTAGRDVEGCFHSQGPSSELWRLDRDTWTLLNSRGPGPRANHVAADIAGRLVVFGGKGKHFLNDLWELNMSRPTKYSFEWRGGGENSSAPVSYYSVNASFLEDDLCLLDVDVYVEVVGDTVDLFGPGPSLGDANFPSPVAPSSKVQLASKIDGPILFDDEGDVKPLSRLSHFDSIDPNGLWTLRVKRPPKSTNVTNENLWRLDLVVEKCVTEYTWTNLTQRSAPPPLAEATGIAVNQSLFIYGGRSGDTEDVAPQLWRYDRPMQTWTELRAAPFPRLPRVVVGRAAVLTPYGLYAVGGVGLVEPQLDLLPDLRNPWAWHTIDHQDPRRPRLGRAHTAMAYMEDELLIHGGVDEAGFVLGDTWLYKLGNTSLTKPKELHKCAFHFRPGGAQTQWSTTCGTTLLGSECTLTSVLFRAWCLGQYQSIVAWPY